MKKLSSVLLTSVLFATSAYAADAQPAQKRIEVSCTITHNGQLVRKFTTVPKMDAGNLISAIPGPGNKGVPQAYFFGPGLGLYVFNGMNFGDEPRLAKMQLQRELTPQESKKCEEEGDPDQAGCDVVVIDEEDLSDLPPTAEEEKDAPWIGETATFQEYDGYLVKCVKD
jgi:hypothetical protein